MRSYGSLVLPRRSPLSRASHHLATPVTIGVRREDPTRIWERRCPITPDAVHELVKDGARVLVQECSRRVYRTEEFVRAGAQVHPTLEPAHIILGIKETPLEELMTSPVPSPSSTGSGQTFVSRTHMMFSHTIKGQPYNMPLLSRFVKSESAGSSELKAANAMQGQATHKLLPRLIDWELLTDEGGKRTVGFGWFAGVAGVLESLSALAHLHLELGVASPFLYTPRPHMHPFLSSIRSSLRAVGAMIKESGTPKEVGPLVIGVTGAGKVAQGMLDILSDLPIAKVRVQDLHALVQNPETDLHKIYVVHALPQDYFARTDGKAYSREDYYAHSAMYTSNFDVKIYPYLTLLLHGAGWAQGFPRLMTNDGLGRSLEIARSLRGGDKGRARCVGDVACDVEGGLEFLPHHSTLSEPFFTTRPSTLPNHLPSVTMMAVDILPSSLPLDASEHFSKGIMEYLRAIVHEYQGKSHEDNEPAMALERATVASNGELKGANVWLQGPLGTWRDSIASAAAGSSPISTESLASGVDRRIVRPEQKKRVLLLGSGMVAGPVVEHIGKRGDVELVVASNVLADAEKLAKRFGMGNAKAVLLNVGDRETVGSLIDQADVVISLLPVQFHPSIAELCIERKKHMVTASYISPAMKELDARALSSSTLILNEIGLDPGIDHCSAFSLLAAIRSQRKQVKSFVSFCGGLPAPECAGRDEDGPLGYKFSWSVLGVLRAAREGARFRLDGQDHAIPGESILRQHFPNVPVSDVFRLEGIANRDSLPYAETYGLGKPEKLRTLLRGTLRYPGFCNLMHSFKQIGLLEFEPLIKLNSWASLVGYALEAKIGEPINDDPLSILSVMTHLIPASSFSACWLALSWFGAVPPLEIRRKVGLEVGMPPLPKQATSPIELFATLLGHKLAYRAGERDMVVLHHEIIASQKTAAAGAASPEEVHTSTLITYGTPTHSAMALSVGLPVALAALQILDGKVKMRGVKGPGEESLWKGVLQGMEEAGMGMRESVRIGSAGNQGIGLGMEGVLAKSFN